ncbi:methyltransferase domain-containing protein [Marinihelvus fidelis]|uniref:Methyltransferase domain-containing protein n=1 Tax=Marinihelvus fidelis TaxID=2613842 RepID=A0A5N0TF80_9GAMM|nr:methyltransferase domain-containing protein [Marinihelvus fidelis]KAA9133124.1 methyltransferase domain-containing protein [Marinihelvus fidelis]
MGPRKLPADHDSRGFTAAKDELCRVIDALGPYRVLVVSTRPGVFEGLAHGQRTRVFRVAPAVSGAHSAGGCVAVSLRALAFQSEVFDLVVAHGLVKDGDERLLGELRRVLKPGAHLLVLGPGRYGFGRWRRDQRGLQSIRPWRLCQRLRQRSFVLESRAGLGIAGTSMNARDGWRRLLFGFADQVAVLARLSPVRPIVSRVRFARPASSGAGVQAMESALEQTMNRKEQSA